MRSFEAVEAVIFGIRGYKRNILDNMYKNEGV